MTRDQIEHVVSPTAIKQQFDKYVARGILPESSVPAEFRTSKGYDEPQAIAADVVDAVKWQDTKVEDLQAMKVKDVKQEHPWVDEILENFVAYDLSPTHSSDEARLILNELDKELEALEESGYGPDARDYVFKLKRELELLIEKM